MTQDQNEQTHLPTSEGRLVIALSKTLFEKNVDGAFSIIGEYLDENDLQVSQEVIEEYQFANRIRAAVT